MLHVLVILSTLLTFAFLAPADAAVVRSSSGNPICSSARVNIIAMTPGGTQKLIARACYVVQSGGGMVEGDHENTSPAGGRSVETDNPGGDNEGHECDRPGKGEGKKGKKGKSNSSEHNGKGGNDGKGGKSRDGSKNSGKGKKADSGMIQLASHLCQPGDQRISCQ